MRFLVDCQSCTQPKLPLVACDACGAEARPIEERRAWREALHAHHLARLQEVSGAAAPLEPVAELRPRRVLIRLGSDPGAPQLAAGGEEAATPLSFDWHERRGLRRLRRTA